MCFSLTERKQMAITASNIEYYNSRKGKKGKLSVNYYVDGGNKADVLIDGDVILIAIPIESAFYTVAGIIRANERERR